LNCQPLRRALIFLLMASPVAGCTSARYVDRIEIVNPTEYDLLVDVRPDQNASRLGLGLAKHGSQAMHEQVIDLGEEWIFAFSYVGEEVGSLTIKRSDLESAGWRVVIPDEIGAKLRERGVKASY
jgi:hypothetical protein